MNTNNPEAKPGVLREAWDGLKRDCKETPNKAFFSITTCVLNFYSERGLLRPLGSPVSTQNVGRATLDVMRIMGSEALCLTTACMTVPLDALGFPVSYAEHVLMAFRGRRQQSKNLT